MASASPQCPVCAPIVSWSEKCLELRWDATDCHNHYPGGTTFGTFDQSFKNGCQVCGIIHSAVSRFFKDHRSHADITAQTVVTVQYLPHRRSTIELVVDIGIGEPLGLFTEERESTLPFAFGQLRPIITDYSSPELDRFIQEALGTCSRDHQRCGILQSVPLPKRLINVGDTDQSPFLYTSFEGESGQYICLSHCWGSPNYTLKTLKGNLEAHGREIPISDMPRTFSEAVMLTRRIGPQYIWIDSLCIVQDDEDDWKSESERMAQTYTNSLITIVAVEAADSREGLLPRISADQCNISYIDWPVPDAQIHKVYICQTQHCSKIWDAYNELRQLKLMASENAVLFSRAWTLQELLLPPRLLMFTDRGPIWYCNESFQPATDPIPFDFMLYFKGSYQSLLLEESPGSGLDRPTKLFTESQIINDIFNISTFADGWVRLVEMYTSRHVAFRQDRLRALAGLAKKFQQQSKAEYVAGLWDDKASLPFLLVWDAVPVESKREKPCEDPTDCTRSWNPPSWSWASVEGAISWTWDLDDFRADAQIMDISCQWQDANRFSTSLGGEVTMKARALKLPHSSLSYSSQDDSADIKVRYTSDNIMVAPGNYYYQIPYEDLFSQELLFQVPAQSREAFLFQAPGSDCDLHRLDWIKKHTTHSVEVYFVLLGYCIERPFTLILAQHPGTGNFIRIDSGERLFDCIYRLNDYDHTAAEHFRENLEKLFSLSMEIILT